MPFCNIPINAVRCGDCLVSIVCILLALFTATLPWNNASKTARLKRWRVKRMWLKRACYADATYAHETQTLTRRTRTIVGSVFDTCPFSAHQVSSTLARFYHIKCPRHLPVFTASSVLDTCPFSRRQVSVLRRHNCVLVCQTVQR